MRYKSTFYLLTYLLTYLLIGTVGHSYLQKLLQVCEQEVNSKDVKSHVVCVLVQDTISLTRE